MAQVVIGGLLAAIPATIAALAAWRASKDTHYEMRTNHGMRAGEYLELISGNINDIKDAFVEHKEEDKRFQDEVRKLLPLPKGSEN